MRISEDSPIFVVGVPRSGTTLLSAMLCAHPGIAIAPETHFCNKWLRQYQEVDVRSVDGFDYFWAYFVQSENFRSLQIDPEETRDRILSQESHDFKDVFATILMMYAERRGKLRWGEKTPAHYLHIGLLLDWYPHARIIYVLRDPRAVVSSLLRVPLPWKPRPIDQHATRWRQSVSSLVMWETEPRVYIVQYERLVTDPESSLRKLCGFIQEDFTPSMLDHIAAASPLVNAESWKESVLQPVTTNNVDKWQHYLSHDEVALVEHIVRREMLRYGYQPITAGLKHWQIFTLHWTRAMRRLKRKILCTRKLFQTQWLVHE